MPLTETQVIQVKERSAGWERNWWALYVELMQHLDRATSELVLPVPWPSDNEREDFISHLLAGYDRRARSGVLLADYEVSRGDPISYLSSTDFLRRRAISFLRKRCRPLPESLLREGRRQVPLDSDKSPIVPDRHSLSSIETELMDTEIREALGSIVLAIPADRKITRVIEQAGLQLYPRMQWAETDLQCLRQHLERVLAEPGPEWPDRFSMLAAMHAEARRGFNDQLNTICDQIYNEGKGVSPRRDGLLRNRLDKLRFEKVFLPLAAAILMRLLAITRTDADQRRSRYRDSLPDILPQLGVLHKRAIGDGNGIGTAEDDS